MKTWTVQATTHPVDRRTVKTVTIVRNESAVRGRYDIEIQAGQARVLLTPKQSSELIAAINKARYTSKRG